MERGTWAGRGSGAFYAALADASPPLHEVALVSSRAASVLSSLACELTECAAVLRSADEARRRSTEVFEALAADARIAAAQDDWETAVRRAAGRLRDLAAGESGRPAGFDGHARDFVARAWSAAVVEPVSTAWGLTGEAFVDPPDWWVNVRAAVTGIVDTVRHPVEAGKDAVAWDDFAQGDSGAGLGDVVGGAATVGAGRVLRRLDGDRRSRGGDPPWPKAQSPWEMLARVDLRRHEHPEFGHTIARHVDIDDEGLRRRLVDPNVKAASRFHDLDTAESVITEALRTRVAEFQAFVDSGGRELVLRVAVDRDVGVLLDREALARGSPPRPARNLRIVLRHKHGRVFITTAYVEDP